MLKKIVLVLLSTNLLMSEPVIENNLAEEALLCAVKAGVWCGIGVGAVVTCGLISAGISAAIPVAIVGAKFACAKAVAAPIAIKLNAAIVVGRAGRKFVYSNPEEMLQAALKNESCERSKARLDFEKCLNRYNVSNDPNSLDVPRACEEAGILFTMLEQEKLSQGKNK